MSPARSLYPTATLPSLIALALVAGGACGYYSPQPVNGKQSCGAERIGKVCPSGYHCALDSKCWRIGMGPGSSGWDAGAVPRGTGGVGPTTGDPFGDGSGGTGLGGLIATGGRAGVPDGGGTPASGGAVGTGGRTGTTDVTTSGGAPGGVTTTGGSTASGGVTATGGAVSSGGAVGTGGKISTGGAPGTGGKLSTGGAPSTGGVTSTGGAPGTGGKTSTGGAPGTGGKIGTGGAGTGGKIGTGGAPGTWFTYAVGDIADCDQIADSATALQLDGSTDPILALGDIAYEHGSTEDFANCFEPVWGRHKARIHPAPGNHEYETPGATPYFAYFGAAAGEPNLGYYSFDIGPWHVVSLNSNCTQNPADVNCDAGSPQETWLRQDLAAHPSQCTLAMWHHPRFSSGANRNNPVLQPLWQALMDYGVDLLLVGHDHGYERFVPLDAVGLPAANGITEIIVGTGGTNLIDYGGTPDPTTTVVRNRTSHGVLQLALRKDGYDWQFLPIPGDTLTDQGSAACH